MRTKDLSDVSPAGATLGAVILCALLLAVIIFFYGCVEEPTEAPQQPGLNIDIDLRPPAGSPVESLDEFSDDYLRAACRIRGGGSGGSGTCFKIDGQYVYVLTARHVVGKTKSFFCEFWIDGRISGKYAGKVIKVLKVDAAVIAIPVSEFKDGKLPVAIPISRTPPDISKPIVSVGSPRLRWQKLFEGHITKLHGGKARYGAESFEFFPPPVGGQSGAGIIQDRKIVGILWGTTGKKGYAVNCMDLWILTEHNDIFFTADWCTFCEEMVPVVATLDGIEVIDYDLNSSLAYLYGVTKLPAYVNESGKVLYGVRTERELREFFEAGRKPKVKPKIKEKPNVEQPPDRWIDDPWQPKPIPPQRPRWLWRR